MLLLTKALEMSVSLEERTKEREEALFSYVFVKSSTATTVSANPHIHGTRKRRKAP